MLTAVLIGLAALVAGLVVIGRRPDRRRKPDGDGGDGSSAIDSDSGDCGGDGGGGGGGGGGD